MASGSAWTSTLPEGIAEDDGGTAAFDEFIGQELAAEVELDAEGLEEIAEDADTIDGARLAAVHELGLAEVEIGDEAADILKRLVIALIGLEPIDTIGSV